MWENEYEDSEKKGYDEEGYVDGEEKKEGSGGLNKEMIGTRKGRGKKKTRREGGGGGGGVGCW